MMRAGNGDTGLQPPLRQAFLIRAPLAGVAAVDTDFLAFEFGPEPLTYEHAKTLDQRTDILCRAA
jgi:hypothetical protein